MIPRIIFIRHKVKCLFTFAFLVYILNYFGAFTHFYEKEFENFEYPLNLDYKLLLQNVNQLRHGHKSEVPPINHYNFTYNYNCELKCKNEDDRGVEFPRMVFIIKSAMENFNRRVAIRNTWGYEKRFSDVKIKCVFMLGVSKSENVELQKLIDLEANRYNDIVQANFIDTYFNNTIKTMMGLKWAVQYCNTSRFYMFVDDDYYVSTKNVLRFIRNPVNFPEYLEEANEQLRKLTRRRLYSSLLKHNETETGKRLPVTVKNNTDEGFIRDKRSFLDLPINIKLFAGFVFHSSSPHRHKSSKFYVSLQEYEWDKWPAYITAGSYILSHDALLELYYTAFFTKHFRFDDIYLGILAHKAHIDLLHSEEFYFYKAPYVGHSYKYVIASHGYEDYLEMLRVWNSNKAAGYA